MKGEGAVGGDPQLWFTKNSGFEENTIISDNSVFEQDSEVNPN